VVWNANRRALSSDQLQVSLEALATLVVEDWLIQDFMLPLRCMKDDLIQI